MRVQLPDGNLADFPDTMSQDQITSVLKQKYPATPSPATSSPAAPAEAAPPPALSATDRAYGLNTPKRLGEISKAYDLGPVAGLNQRLSDLTSENIEAGKKLFGEGWKNVKGDKPLKGVGEMALGGLGYALAPGNAALTAAVSDPITRITGSEFAGDTAAMVAPIPGLRASGAGKQIVDTAEKAATNSKLVDFGKRVLAPNLLTKDSRETDRLITAARGTRKQLGEQVTAKLEQFRPVVNQMPDADRIKVMDYVEGNTAQPLSPQQQAIGDSLKAVYQKYRHELENHPKTEKAGMVEDYMAHEWEDPAQAQNFIESYFQKQGSGKNLQARKYATIQEGLKAGLKLRTTDPLDVTIRYAKNMDSYLAHADAFHALEDQGLIAYPKKPPDGWKKVDGRFSQKDFVGVDQAGEPFHVKHEAAAPDAVASTFNRYISKKPGGVAGEALEKAQQVSSAATSAKMLGGVSYHSLAITKMATAAAIKNAGGALLRGDIKGAGRALSGGLKTIYGKTGSEYVDAYLGKKPLPPQKQEILDAMQRADAVSMRAPDYMVTGRGRSLWSAAARRVKGIEKSLPQAMKADLKELYKDKGALGKLGETINYIGDTISGPVFDHWIPRVKTGVVAESLQAWRTAHPQASMRELDDQAREISRMVDNHFGEMNKDKIYWNRTSKDLAALMFLSYSWVSGTLVATARGAGGIAKTALRGDRLNQEGQMMLATIATDALLASAYQYLKTGKAPEEPKDYIFPKTGGRRYKTQERALMPGHEQQVSMYATDPIGELSNEMSPLVTGLWRTLRGTDYFGRPEDRGETIKDMLTPIPFQSYGAREKGTGISKPETLMGLRPANEAITNPKLKAFQERKYQEIPAEKARRKAKMKLEDK